MNIPEVIKVGGVLYKVVFTHDISESETWTGCCVFSKQEIRIKPDMGKEYTEEVFCHELVHAIAKQATVEFGEHEEVIVDSLGKVLQQVLNDNKF